jgi:hypothetical protein
MRLRRRRRSCSASAGSWRSSRCGTSSFAGTAGNWPLADYEIDGLKEGFDDVAKLLGDDIAQKHVGEAMAELEKSVEAKNRDNFVVAFDKLNAGCNACHTTLDHAFIVIQRPTLLPYSNQSFSPQK